MRTSPPRSSNCDARCPAETPWRRRRRHRRHGHGLRGRSPVFSSPGGAFWSRHSATGIAALTRSMTRYHPESGGPVVAIGPRPAGSPTTPGTMANLGVLGWPCFRARSAMRRYRAALAGWFRHFRRYPAIRPGFGRRVAGLPSTPPARPPAAAIPRNRPRASTRMPLMAIARRRKRSFPVFGRSIQISGRRHLDTATAHRVRVRRLF